MGYFSDSNYYKFKSQTVFYSKDIQCSLSVECAMHLGPLCSKTVCKTGNELVELLPQEAVEAEGICSV